MRIIYFYCSKQGVILSSNFSFDLVSSNHSTIRSYMIYQNNILFFCFKIYYYLTFSYVPELSTTTLLLLHILPRSGFRTPKCINVKSIHCPLIKNYALRIALFWFIVKWSAVFLLKFINTSTVLFLSAVNCDCFCPLLLLFRC